MKKIFLLTFMFSIVFLSCEKEDDIPALPDPDDICSAMDDINFRNYCYYFFDMNNDKKISEFEAHMVCKINVDGWGINSLKGIEYFKNLTDLRCQQNNLKVLDISNNSKLTTLYCGFNSLTSLDVSKNTALKNIDCTNNALSKLDVSKNSELVNLGCSYNYLTNLDVSNNTALNRLLCNFNYIIKLDVSKNIELTSLSCGSNSLTKLDVSNNKKLSSLYCHKNSLTRLNVKNNVKLDKLGCNDNKLSAEELNSLFNSLPYVNGSIWFSNNPGTDTCDKGIYENKGWVGYGQ